MKSIVILLAVLMLSGCAGMQFDKQSPMLELVVRAAAGRVLEESPGWVKPAYTITRDAIFALDTGKITQLAMLESYVINAIAEQLTPEEQALAFVLVGSVKQAIISDLGARGIEDAEQTKIRVVSVLSWINQTAHIRM